MARGKLSPDDVKAILLALAAGVPARELARRYGVDHKAITRRARKQAAPALPTGRSVPGQATLEALGIIRPPAKSPGTSPPSPGQSPPAAGEPGSVESARGAGNAGTPGAEDRTAQGWRTRRERQRLERGRREGKGAGPGAEVIAFPRAGEWSAGLVARVEAQDERERAAAAITLAAVRGVLAVDQLRQLDRYEMVLDRLVGMLAAYVAPEEALGLQVDLEGLEPQERAEKVRAFQRDMLGQIAPCERDSLAGTLKAVTDAVGKVIALKREAAGFAPPEAGAGPARSTRVNLGLISSMGTQDLAAVHRAIEILDAEQPRPGAPLPPSP